ncbi:helix-turn-helix transcriptional regulator [Veillonella sp. 3960]|uniref:helix-turn-helix domain-containing protein n=1 Tax=Veillonella sp. 3960 TaxID=2490955 RepID=UPI000F8E7EEA|nr:helix-turn-helix transcriptional regulator [Veillonella sp. 3960]
MIICNLELVLQEKGLKPFPLSKELNLPRSFINALIENTFQTINVESVDRLCKYLDIAYTELFTFYPFYIDFKDKTDTSFTLDICIKNSNCYEEYMDEIYSNAESFSFSYELNPVNGNILVDINNADYEKCCNFMFDTDFFFERMHFWTNNYLSESNFLEDISTKVKNYLKSTINPSYDIKLTERFFTDCRVDPNKKKNFYIQLRDRLNEKIDSL